MVIARLKSMNDSIQLCVWQLAATGCMFTELFLFMAKWLVY